jgi:hypothetical protein
MPEALGPTSSTPVASRRAVLAFVVGTLAAVAVQPLVFLARLGPALLSSPNSLNDLGFMVGAVAVVAAAVVLLLGIPAFLLLRKFRRESWASVGVTGALLGALPNALFWPTRTTGYSAGNNWHGVYVDTYVNGVPTIYAWLQHGESVLWFSVHGLTGALAFYAVWRRLAGAPR